LGATVHTELSVTGLPPGVVQTSAAHRHPAVVNAPAWAGTARWPAWSCDPAAARFILGPSRCPADPTQVYAASYVADVASE
jgi:hypothetical protein